MVFSSLITELIGSLRCLPGVGPKSAQKMALHLLERDHEGAEKLANVLREALDKVGRCTRCRNLTEETECQICRNHSRDETVICVVETPADVAAMEASGRFDGFYFVLLGHLSPIDGIGPDELGLDKLESIVANRNIKEVIVATNSTLEGEATCHYIAELLKPYNKNITRIAHGMPMGGELEYIDSNTLAFALDGRKAI